jgi:hypothetical protein
MNIRNVARREGISFRQTFKFPFGVTKLKPVPKCIFAIFLLPSAAAHKMCHQGYRFSQLNFLSNLPTLHMHIIIAPLFHGCQQPRWNSFAY